MLKTWLSVGTLSLTVCLMAPAQTKSDLVESGRSLVIEVGGKQVTIADLEQKHPTALFQARNAYYEAQKKALEDFIDEYVLDAQAAKEHVTVAELLKLHVDDQIAKDPSDEALRVYWEGLNTTSSFEATRDKILDSLRDKRKAKIKAAYMTSLKKEWNVKELGAPPRVEVSLDKTPIRGNAKAPLTLVEFADFECGFCQQIQPVLDKLQAEYKDTLKIAYKDTPLPMHPHAEKAAEAAHCAEAQGQYWQYHDLLYTSKKLEIPALKEQARELKMDGDAFDKCLDSGANADLVKAEVDQAIAVGLQGTPSFFINGRFFYGINTYEGLKNIVEEELGALARRKHDVAAR